MSPDTPEENLARILASDSYLPAHLDLGLLDSDPLRPVRLMLELLKPELALANERIASTIVVFGGTQVVEEQDARRRLEAARQALQEQPEDAALARRVSRAERILEKSRYYEMAREFAALVSAASQQSDALDHVIVTGGGPGIMEAANRGAFDVGAKSIGLNITLPEEQAPNAYITPELCFQFRYFALRKMHFLLRARALVIFPGGYGTLDELFDALTLRQTLRIDPLPIVLVGREYWRRVIDFDFLADEGTIADEHVELVRYAESAEAAWDEICRFHAESSG